MKAGRIALVLMFALSVVALSVTAYVTAYVQLGTYHDWRDSSGWATDQVVRDYAENNWCPTLFAPAAAVESKWIGCPVHLTNSRVPPIESVDSIIDQVR